MGKKIAGCALLAVLCLIAVYRSPAIEKDQTERILSLENAWNEAEGRHDVGALSLLLADTFVSTDADGSFASKKQWLAQIKTTADQYELIANSGVKVNIYDNAAVATGVYREKIKVGGKFVDRSGRFTDTWIAQGGQWRCVASQSTLITH